MYISLKKLHIYFICSNFAASIKGMTYWRAEVNSAPTQRRGVAHAPPTL